MHKVFRRKEEMNKLFSIILFVALILSPYLSASTETMRAEVKLTEVVKEALENNPLVRAAHQEWQAALERVPQAKSLPDPMVSYSRFGSSIETRLGPQRNKISLSQSIPFFGKLSLKGRVAERGASVLEEQYNRARAEVILEVKVSYYTLYWLDNVIQISQEEKEVLKRLARIAQKKYETGQANQQDVLKAQLEMSKVEDKILSLNQARKAAASELNALLDRSPDSPVGMAKEPEIYLFGEDVETLYQLAEEERPEMRKARRIIEMNEESLRLAKKNYYPDFKIMFDYVDIGGGTTGQIEDGRDSWMGSIGINIPIWRGKLHAAEAEAALQLKASQERYTEVKNETLSRVSSLHFEAETAEDQISLYKYSLLPQAEQAFKASEVSYLAGKVDFLNLLDSERMVLMVKTGYHKAISDYGKSLARLERAVGKELKTRRFER
jgi:cobalt-zinc-cadmium efflux system outer membrane protein